MSIHPANDNSIIGLTFRDKSVLYAAYMPFIKGGGLFLPSNDQYKLGDQLKLVLHLMDETERFPLNGKVIWITPNGSQGNRSVGVGIQFEGEEGEVVKNKIETYLAGMLKSERLTHTM